MKIPDRSSVGTRLSQGAGKWAASTEQHLPKTGALRSQGCLVWRVGTSDVVGLKGDLRKDTSKPDGTPKKLMDNSRIAALGWSPKISLREGVEAVYRDAPFR